MVVAMQVGTVDFVNGTVNINPVSFQQIFGNGINLYVNTKAKNITAYQNIMLAINFQNININAIPQLLDQ